MISAIGLKVDSSIKACSMKPPVDLWSSDLEPGFEPMVFLEPDMLESAVEDSEREPRMLWRSAPTIAAR
jgi:hypothetical protein